MYKKIKTYSNLTILLKLFWVNVLIPRVIELHLICWKYFWVNVFYHQLLSYILSHASYIHLCTSLDSHGNFYVTVACQYGLLPQSTLVLKLVD